MPALPGAASSSGRCGLRSSARTSACSRPPAADDQYAHRAYSAAMNSSTGIATSDSYLRGAARAELERHARHRLLVRRLDDVHEVEAAERGPLRLDRRTELLDLLVHLADPRGVVLDRLDPLGVSVLSSTNVGMAILSLVGVHGGFLASFGRRCKVRDAAAPPASYPQRR